MTARERPLLYRTNNYVKVGGTRAADYFFFDARDVQECTLANEFVSSRLTSAVKHGACWTDYAGQSSLVRRIGAPKNDR